MNILAIDTSNHTLGIALLRDNVIVGEYITNIKRNHSVRVMPAIEQLMKECNLIPAELNRIAVAKGPGSYTGVRIGVTIAKTMAWTLGIPLTGVSSLAVVAASARYFDGPICPIFDARRGLIYTGLYQYQNGQLETLEEDQNILTSEWVDQLSKRNESILFIGNDVSIHKETIFSKLKHHAIFSAISEQNPRPSELAILGLSLPEETNVHQFSPNYIRLVEAEAKWLEKQERKK